MTGHQPHPGTGINALGDSSPRVRIEDICKSIVSEVRVVDPFEMQKAAQNVYEMIQIEGLKVLIFRHECPLNEPRAWQEKPAVYVDQEKCIGDECGCARFCSRVFKCPGMTWDYAKAKAKVDESICTRCGLCADICPQGAIKSEEAA